MPTQPKKRAQPPTRKTPAAKSKTPAKATATKQPAAQQKSRSQDSPVLSVTAEAVVDPFKQDEEHLAADRERAELHKPGRASRADAKQIDNSPGYDRDQLAHMREYFGINPDDSTVEAEQGAEVEEVV